MMCQAMPLLAYLETQQAIDTAQEATRNWYSDCLSFAEQWIYPRRGTIFTSEDIIDAFNASHQFRPNEVRVWGAVMRKLKKDKKIQFVGIVPYRKPQGHMRPTNQWTAV